jgi:hypothetical protein
LDLRDEGQRLGPGTARVDLGLEGRDLLAEALAMIVGEWVP